MSRPPERGPDPIALLRSLMHEGRLQEVIDWDGTSAEDPAGVPDAALLVATAATRLGDLRLARARAASALAGFSDRADRDGLIRCRNLLGAIAFEEGRLADAAKEFGAAHEMAAADGDTLMVARTSNNLAAVTHLRGDEQEALSWYRTALLAYQRLGDQRGQAETYHNLAMAFRRMNALDDADAASLNGARMADTTGDPWLLALILAGRAEVSLARGDTELGLGLVDRAGQLAATAGDPVGVGESHRVRGLLALARGDAESARHEASAGREIAEQHGSALLGAECRALEAVAMAELGMDYHDVAAAAESSFRRLGAVALLRDFQTDIAERAG